MTLSRVLLRPNSHRSGPAAELSESLELFGPDREAAEAVASGLRDAKAENTRRSYASAWRRFLGWADPCGHRTPPPSRGPLSGSGQPVHGHYGGGSRRRRDAECRQPCLPPGGGRCPGPGQACAPAAQARPRGTLESLENAHKRAALDLAIIGVQADGGLRRSDPAGLTRGRWSYGQTARAG